ncbi:hypothetical protein JOC85_004355 [Bacillus mesophilus]|uniref:Uncharacterized protein n=1 Tax=Bacillus mesophilus TaxID=1808955 RepID=A0A6M0QCT7_9BACI|nr:CBO0543 family protein [Bacillus mesophilus]MBM7663479.1 hypothetical protein [Bacillus mesophilus]NEY74171.1 hypothetical protein [Bacillus mesophilus]
MLNALYAAIWLFALWKWGDWENWRNYYPTILYFIIGDFLYLYLLSDAYPMWRYVPPIIDEEMGVTNSHVSLSVMLIKYPATILIFLSKFPTENTWKKILYILGWVSLYGVNELIDLNLGTIEHYNGWNFWWSSLFNLVLFSILRVHYRQPPLAWLLSMIFMVILWNIFNVPSYVFR